jgi:hypothetical protein
MNEYEIKFEFYGRKMKTTIEAKSEDEAKYLIMGKIKFYDVKKIDKSNDYDLPEGFDFLFKPKP